MPRDLRLYLSDILQAGDDITEFLTGKQFADYDSDRQLRRAVERSFEIIGEALTQARKLYPEACAAIEENQPIISFRNRIMHGYFSIDDETVWSIAKLYLPNLLEQVRALHLQTEQMLNK